MCLQKGQQNLPSPASPTEFACFLPPQLFWGRLKTPLLSILRAAPRGTALPPERSEKGLLFRSHLQSGFCYAFWFEMFLRVNVDPFHFLDMDFEDFFLSFIVLIIFTLKK